MRYRIKNQKLAELVYSVFDEADVQSKIVKRIEEGWDDVRLCSHELNDCYTTKLNPDYEYLSDKSNYVFFVINKKNLEKIREFDPAGWNPYPAVKPPKYKNYLVQLLYTTGERILVTANWTPLGYWVRNVGKHDWDSSYDDNPDIVAFRELPDFYESEKQE